MSDVSAELQIGQLVLSVRLPETNREPSQSWMDLENLRELPLVRPVPLRMTH